MLAIELWDFFEAFDGFFAFALVSDPPPADAAGAAEWECDAAETAALLTDCAVDNSAGFSDGEVATFFISLPRKINCDAVEDCRRSE